VTLQSSNFTSPWSVLLHYIALHQWHLLFGAATAPKELGGLDQRCPHQGPGRVPTAWKYSCILVTPVLALKTSCWPLIWTVAVLTFINLSLGTPLNEHAFKYRRSLCGARKRHSTATSANVRPSVYPSVRWQHFQTLRLRYRWAEVGKTWHMGLGTKLPGSGILNFGSAPRGADPGLRIFRNQSIGDLNLFANQSTKNGLGNGPWCQR